MSIALMGAERSGKSTLARAFAKARDYTFLPSPMARVYEELGLPVGQLGLGFEDRMRVQEKALDYHVQAIRDAIGQLWISDRSSLDMAAYTLLDAAQGDDYDHDRVAAYIDRCFRVASTHYGVIVLVQPGIPYVVEAGKPPANVSRQDAFNLMLWGMAQDNRLDCRSGFLKRDVLALQERLDCLGYLVDHMTSLDVRHAQQLVLH